MDENEKRNEWMKMKKRRRNRNYVYELYFAYNGGWGGEQMSVEKGH
jgi:hypothetical protein